MLKIWRSLRKIINSSYHIFSSNYPNDFVWMLGVRGTVYSSRCFFFKKIIGSKNKLVMWCWCELLGYTCPNGQLRFPEQRLCYENLCFLKEKFVFFLYGWLSSIGNASEKELHATLFTCGLSQNRYLSGVSARFPAPRRVLTPDADASYNFRNIRGEIKPKETIGKPKIIRKSP